MRSSPSLERWTLDYCGVRHMNEPVYTWVGGRSAGLAIIFLRSLFGARTSRLMQGGGRGTYRDGIEALVRS